MSEKNSKGICPFGSFPPFPQSGPISISRFPAQLAEKNTTQEAKTQRAASERAGLETRNTVSNSYCKTKQIEGCMTKKRKHPLLARASLGTGLYSWRQNTAMVPVLYGVH